MSVGRAIDGRRRIGRYGYGCMTASPRMRRRRHEDGEKEEKPERDVEHENTAPPHPLSDAKVAAAGIEACRSRYRGAARQASVERHGPRQPGGARSGHAALSGDRARGPQADRRSRRKGDVLAIVESNQSLTPYELKAPLAGTVIDRQTTLGEYVSEQKPAFVIADLSTVWVDFSVYRRDLKRVKIGDQVLIDPADGGGRSRPDLLHLAGRQQRHPERACPRGRAESEQRLRPGLFVTARLILPRSKVAVAVKSSTPCRPSRTGPSSSSAGRQVRGPRVEIGERDPDRGDPVGVRANSTRPRTASS